MCLLAESSRAPATCVLKQTRNLRKLKNSTMAPSKKPGQVDWRNLSCGDVILNDLKKDFLPLTEEELLAEMAWEHYKNLSEFVKPGVVFEQFKERLANHRKQVAKWIQRVTLDAAAVEQAKAKHPYPTHNHRGRRNFHLSFAEDILRQDVQAKCHEGMSLLEFQRTWTKYGLFTKDHFKDLVKQTI